MDQAQIAAGLLSPTSQVQALLSQVPKAEARFVSVMLKLEVSLEAAVAVVLGRLKLLTLVAAVLAQAAKLLLACLAVLYLLRYLA